MFRFCVDGVGISQQLDFGEVIAKIKSFLAQTSTMASLLVELMIVSELWFEDSKICLITWIPDLDPKSGKLVYTKKRIVYNMKSSYMEIKSGES